MKRFTAVILLLVMSVPIMCLNAGCDDWRIDAFRANVLDSLTSGVLTGIGNAAGNTADAIGGIIGDALIEFVDDVVN